MPPVSPDINTFTVGDTWTDAQREYLEVFFTAINAAAEPVRYKCLTSVKEHQISVQPSSTGDGVFGAKDVSKYTYAGYYYGVVENARKFKDDGYSIGIPPITFPDGTVVPAVLSGYNFRAQEGNASMFNHACREFNARFVFEDVYVKKNIDAVLKVQRLAEDEGSIIPESLLEAASEILFSYSVVVVMTHMDVGAGDEIRVTYNRDGRSSYFSTRKNAKKSAKKGYCIAKCMCEPGGCPLNRFYVTKRLGAAQP